MRDPTRGSLPPSFDPGSQVRQSGRRSERDLLRTSTATAGVPGRGLGRASCLPDRSLCQRARDTCKLCQGGQGVGTVTPVPTVRARTASTAALAYVNCDARCGGRRPAAAQRLRRSTSSRGISYGARARLGATGMHASGGSAVRMLASARGARCSSGSKAGLPASDWSALRRGKL